MLYLLIILLSIIQSIIGVGVLLFGTPILLLAGYDFIDVLILLLPISFAISLTTFLSTSKKIKFSRGYIVLPIFIFFGTYFGTITLANFISMIVGIMLIVLSSKYLFFRNFKTITIPNSSRFKLIVLNINAFIHGLSNQGGAILVWLSKYFYQEKYLRRSFIAFIYGYMAIFQFISTSFLHYERLAIFDPILVALGIFSFFLGNKLFTSLKQNHYDFAINLLTFIIGILLLIRNI